MPDGIKNEIRKLFPPTMPATTFGSQPVITDIESRKAYQSWLIVRVVYEISRWIGWVVMIRTLGEKFLGLWE